MGAARLRITAFPTVSSTGTEWTTDWFRIRNVNSGKVLGVDRMSTADSAYVVQFDDNGTADHLWQVLLSGRAPAPSRRRGPGHGERLTARQP